uniref:Lysosomal dipeptide transporter MFSD1 n=1 Tax=Pseudo-nitzschia australis TaxID=44445 RepID=A0A7S4EGY2_9STRA|mmetsp:Transcript_5772/g.12551  ORF Transcript_5772/g.12551 Transcript_5772/m.12551 type:complete len:590 (+) Transcript_5772:184-1953(+)
MRGIADDETTKLVQGNEKDERGQTQSNNAGNSSDRYKNLALIAFTTPGVKFFKSAQSSFQEYLMTDRELQMSATTYGFLLSLISMPIVPLLGGALLDYKKGGGGHGHGHRHHDSSNRTTKSNCVIEIGDSDSDDDDDGNQHDIVTSLRGITTAPSGTALQTNQKASQSNAYCAFLGVTLFGIVVYGFGLDEMHSIPLGLLGAFIFGVGEGCVMVAARAFVGHEFWGGDGAFAQGVLIAVNNLSMMASKNIVPWLIETEHELSTTTGSSGTENSGEDVDIDVGADNSIRVGIIACCVVQYMALCAGLLYAARNGGLCSSSQRNPSQREQHGHHHHHHSGLRRVQEQHDEKDECEEYRFRHNVSTLAHTSKPKVDCGPKSRFSSMAVLVNLPMTFWIVAIGRAIFLVTFKVFSRYSNSFLIEEYGVDAVKAGRISSVNEFFALFSPLVGYLAYRSPGGIVAFALGGAFLGTVSIGSLAFLPAVTVMQYLPGGPLTPMVGISIAHGIIIPISIAMIPHTVPVTQLGMAFAVFEVLGQTLNLTDIVFGWLRDDTGDYEKPMQLLFTYALTGTLMLWISRKRIGSIGLRHSSDR